MPLQDTSWRKYSIDVTLAKVNLVVVCHISGAVCIGGLLRRDYMSRFSVTDNIPAGTLSESLGSTVMLWRVY